MAKESVSTSELKTHCSKIIDEVANDRRSVVITKRGRVVAKIVPIDEERESIFGFARGSITVKGDILAPIGEAWEAAE